MSDAEEYKSTWDALADTPEEGANLRFRSELMNEVSSFVQDRHWTQSEAAARCGITQPRMNDLLRGRISKFSLDALVNIAAPLGLT
ncbi:MAG: XRE family transcriptional regulator, partial [Synergistaceae bacterium]|nr:XRE family transcriptional regulator [Synergistaceae bacterium]